MLSFSTYAQTTEATVLSKVRFGGYYFYFLESNSSQDLFKTSVFYNDELTEGQRVELSRDEQNDNYRIVSPATDQSAIAKKLNNNIDEDVLSYIKKLDLPILENEILFFRDTAHLYKFSDQFYKLDDELTEDLELDDLLDALESLYNGYYSFRTYLNDKYKIAEYDDEDEFDEFGMTDEEFLAFEEEDFIADRVHRSIFNSNRLIGIGERVYYYHGLNQIISTSVTDKNGIQEFIIASIKQDYNIYDMNNPFMLGVNFEFEKNPNISFIKPNFDIFVEDDVPPKGGFIHVPTSMYYSTIPVGKNSIGHCDAFTKALTIETYVAHLNLENDPNDPAYQDPWSLVGKNAVLTIDWNGDGSYIEVINNYNNETIYHTYSSEGEFKPKTTLAVFEPYLGFTIVIQDGYGTDGEWITFNTEVACTDEDAAKWKHTENNNWRLRSKIWSTNNIFGMHAGSYSQGFEKKNNKWKAKKSKIRTTIDADFRKQCEFETNKTGQRNKNNAKEASRRKTSLFKWSYSIANADVTSTHRLNISGITIQANMVLNPCP